MKGTSLLFLGLLGCVGILAGCKATTPVTNDGSSGQHELTYDGINRTYSVYLPSDLESSGSVPLLVALHGGGGSAEKWPGYTNNGFERLADREGFILVYPNGLEGHWNDGRGVDRFYSQHENIDDAGFLARLIDVLKASYPIDANRVYVTGASNGGMMAHKLAAEYSDKVTAIASVISSIPKNLEGRLYPTHPVAVLMMNGTEDPIVPWDGGAVSFGNMTNGYVMSTQQSLEFWIYHNNCDPSAITTTLPDTDPDDGTRVERMSFINCNAGSEVVLYKVIGGGHAWPAFEDYRGPIGQGIVEALVGRKSRDIDACEVIWEFFKGHARREFLGGVG